MKQKHINDIKLGAFIIVAIVLFLGAIYYIGDQNQLFGSDIRISTVFNNVSGLKVGNNVRLSGIKVGTVYELKIISDSSVSVTMLIEKKAASYIKSDAYALIESEGLMGNKVIAIAGGSPQSPVIEDGDRIASKSSANIDAAIDTFTSTAEEVKRLLEEITDIAARINNGQGLLGRLVADTVLESKMDIIAGNAQRASADAAQTVAALRKTAHAINSGNGIATRLLYDSTLAMDIDRVLDSLVVISENLTATSGNLRTLSVDMNDPDGTLQLLLTDSTVSKDIEEIIRNLREGSDDLEDAVQTVENSWILNVFSGKSKDKKDRAEQDH
jgi:phospholipid/cholesterol/gamma-HCH transport system substrate-binding protein